MTDILLVNPEAHADSYMRVLTDRGLTAQIIQTQGSLFAYPAEYNAINLNSMALSTDVTYKSAIAWNKPGQLLIESMLPGQVLLKNVGHVGLMRNYIKSPFNVEDGQIFNAVSYKGRHVLIDAILFKDAKWGLVTNQDSAKFANNIETVFAHLDTNGILNGPSQIFLEENGTYSIKLTPLRAVNEQYSTRSFLEIWLLILELEETNPKKAFNEFYNWAERTGSSKKFQLLSSMGSK